MNFYDGKMIEVKTTCNNCNSPILWYKIFPNSLQSGIVNCHIIPNGDTICGASIDIISKEDNKAEVEVSYRCRNCYEEHTINGTLTLVNNELILK